EQGHTARCHTDLELGPRPRSPEALLPTTTSSLKLNFFQLRIRAALLPLLPPVLLFVFLRVLFGATARGPTACPQPVLVVLISFEPSHQMVRYHLQNLFRLICSSVTFSTANGAAPYARDPRFGSKDYPDYLTPPDYPTPLQSLRYLTSLSRVVPYLYLLLHPPGEFP
ncbi:hypothetical protein IscW_ISCW022618, partial [Ixodes scapularis]